MGGQDLLEGHDEWPMPYGEENLIVSAIPCQRPALDLLNSVP